MKFKKNTAAKFAALSLVITWLSIGVGNDLRNKEYTDIVKTIETHQFQNTCIVSIDIRTEWPFGWSPTAMDIILEKDGKTVHTSTSKFFKPDRIRKDSGSFYYMFEWSENKNNQWVASYLELEIEKGDTLKWIKAGMCEVPKGQELSSSQNKRCANFSQTSVKCS